MRLRHAKTLITGKPGVGKTTLIRKIVEQMQPLSMSGFHALEIRSRGYRSGFELRGLNGERNILAHVGLESRHRVGKYGRERIHSGNQTKTGCPFDNGNP